jgi:serine protease Do
MKGSRKMKPIKINVLPAIIVGLILSLQCTGEAQERSALERASAEFVTLAKKIFPGVVLITTEKSGEMGQRGKNEVKEDLLNSFFGKDINQNFPPAFKGRTAFRQVGRGSGFLVSSDGYILTSSYLVDNAGGIKVKLHDGREFSAELVGADSKSQVAVLKIEGANFPCLKLGDSSAVEVGALVVSLGHPYGLRATMSLGIVGAVGGSNIGIAEYENFIQTDAVIQSGSSGGPLLNVKGEVIGINSAIASRSGSFEGVGFAIPANMANAVQRQIIATGAMSYGFLGVMIQELGKDIDASVGIKSNKGILVAGVVDNSPARKAGITKGDIILKLNGKHVQSIPAFRNTIGFMIPGTQVTLTIHRNGKQEDVVVILSKAPSTLIKEKDKRGENSQ